MSVKCSKSTSKGRAVTTSRPDAVDRLIEEMAAMTPGQREEVFNRLKDLYCDDCGSENGRQCQCMNDE